MKYVDLHIHSYYSDGTNSPSEILQLAIKADVNTLAITDHNELKGTKELMILSKNADIICIPGVELDCTELGKNVHILGYSFDLENKDFENFVIENRKILDDANYDFVKVVASKDSRVNIEDYESYEYNRRLGGWKAIHYFMDRGVVNTLDESFNLFFEGDFSYEDLKFSNCKKVIDEIHKANGKAIVAHPGRVFKNSSESEFEEILRRFVDLGIDGFECFYPSHTESQTQLCLKICEEFNLYITSGSDCHGNFEKTNIGQMKTTLNQLRLDF